MVKWLRNSPRTTFLLAILVSLAAVDLFILLDIPVLRQYGAFAFYTLVPGILLLYLLNLDRLRLVEKVTLSVGLSFATVTFFGLLINWLLPQMGVTRPLETRPLIISFSIILTILAILVYLKRRESLSLLTDDFSLNIREKMWLLLPALLPLMGIFGTRLMNARDNNSILMATITLMIVYLVVVSIKHDRVSEKIYPVAILCISASFMLVFILRSPHITGADFHYEYHLFSLTANAGQWHIHPNELLDADVVISLLPAIYNSFMKLNTDYFYNLIPRLLYALLPLVVYSISRRYMGSFYAFLAAIFLTSQFTFLDDTGDFRNRVAFFFFALVIMVLVHENLTELSRRLLFILFSAMCVVSNYSTTYVFIIVLILAWIGVQIYPLVKRTLVKRGVLTMLTNPYGAQQSSGLNNTRSVTTIETRIRIGMVMLLCAFIFIWYGQVAGTAFNMGVSFIVTTFKMLGQFSAMDSRSGLVTAAAGGTLRPGEIPQYLELVFSWLTVAFVAVGVLTIVARRLFNIRLYVRGIDELAGKFDTGFLILSVSCCLVLVLTVVLPWASKTYDLARTHFQMMVVLAPFFVIGGVSVAKVIKMRPVYSLALVVLAFYFSITSGLTYEFFGKPHVLYLSSKSLPYEMGYVHDQDSYAAKWLKQYGMVVTLYASGIGPRILMSEGGFGRDVPVLDINRTIRDGGRLDGYVYLTYTFVARGKIALPGYRLADAAPYRKRFAAEDLLYASNGAVIYRTRPQ